MIALEAEMQRVFLKYAYKNNTYLLYTVDNGKRDEIRKEMQCRVR